MKPVTVGGKVIGHSGRLGSAHIFFGTKHGDLKTVEEHFGITIHFVKQVHGDRVVATSPVEADAHWTALRNMAIGIYTADCLPVLLSCEGTKRICAIHAGWRGVRNQIAIKAKEFLVSTGSHYRDLHVAIGPHITEKSFEIENDLGEEILKADPTLAATSLPHENPGKMYVPLKTIMRNQFYDVNAANIIELAEDTLSNPEYFSHRRKPKEGRLISFILRK
jgi:polyphenol oxidase